MAVTSKKHSPVFALSLHAIGATVTLAMLFLSYKLIHQPLERKQQADAARIEQLGQLLKKNGTEAKEYRSLQSQLSQMRQAVAEVHDQLTDNVSSDDVLSSLQQLAAELDLEVLNYQVSPPQHHQQHTLSKIELSCNGSYASICNFLNKAEQLAKVTKLTKFGLDAEAKNQSYPIQLTFVLYSDGESNDTKEKRGVL